MWNNGKAWLPQENCMTRDRGPVLPQDMCPSEMESDAHESLRGKETPSSGVHEA